MKKNTRKMVLPFMATLFMLTLCGGLKSMTPIESAKAESNYSKAVEVEANGGFSEVAGAAIRVSNAGSGIRFTTALTKGYHEALTAQGEVSYVSVMTGNGVSVEREHEYNFDTYFANNDELEMYSTLLFNKDTDKISDSDWAEVYSWDFTVDTYALVNGVPVAKATESNTIRSMREVANTAYYSDESDNKFYQSEVLKNEYLSNLTEIQAGYTDTTTNTTILNIEGAAFAGEKVYVYDGTGTNAKRVEAIVENGNLKITDELTGTDGKEFTVFDDNNKAYHVTTALGKEIKDVASLSVLNTATTGNYFLSSNITMTDEAWVNNNPANFTGVFDGMGYTIANLKTTGLFKGFAGTIKNVAFANAAFSNNNAGIIAFTLLTNTTAIVENVAIKMSENSYGASYGNCGAITRVIYNGTNLIMRNCIIEMKKLAADKTNKGFVAGFIHNGYSQVSPINSYFITNNMLPTGLRGDGDWMGTDDLSLSTIDKLFTKNGTLTNNSWTLVDIEQGITNARLIKNTNSGLKKAYEMYAKIDGKTHIYTVEDLEVLKTATTGTFVLENDIDMAGYTDGTNAYWTNTNENEFTGVLNGQGYVIKNLKTTGLFKRFSGTVKNVGFIDASYVGTEDGIIADQIPNWANAVVSNVIITGIVVPENATYTGAIARQLSEAAKVTLEDVVIEVRGVGFNGIALGFSNYLEAYQHKITAKNCYFISNNMSLLTTRSGAFFNSDNWGENYSNLLSEGSACHYIDIDAGLTDTDKKGFTADLKELYDYMFPATAENN